MLAMFFYFGAALLTAPCQTATDICTKAATREAEERLVLATHWAVGAALLWLLCLARLPALPFHPLETFAGLILPGFWPLLLLAGALNVIEYFFFVRALRLSDAS